MSGAVATMSSRASEMSIVADGSMMAAKTLIISEWKNVWC